MDTAGQAVICLDASSGYSDGTTFTKITSGSWPSDRSLKSVTFSPQQASFVRLEATSGVGGYASAAEIDVADLPAS